MAVARQVRMAPEWDGRFTRMVGVSALVHMVLVALIIVMVERSGPTPLPMVAYTVQITDPSALGGRLPPGAPGRDLKGGGTPPPPPPAAEPPAPPAEAKAAPAVEPEPPPKVET